MLTIDLVVCRMYCHLYLECINGYQVGLGCNEPIFIFIVQLIWHHLSDLEIWSGRCVVQVRVRHTGHAAALQTPTWQLTQKQSIVLAQCDVTWHRPCRYGTAIKHCLWTCNIIVEVLVLQHLRLSLTNCIQFSLCRYNLPQIAGRVQVRHILNRYK